MFKNISSATFVLCITLFVVSSFGFAQEFRDWQSKGGNYKIKAKLVEKTATEVVLEKEDGSTVTVEINKLSAADQQLLARGANVAGNRSDRKRVTSGPMNYDDVGILKATHEIPWDLDVVPANRTEFGEAEKTRIDEETIIYAGMISDPLNTILMLLTSSGRYQGGMTGRLFDIASGKVIDAKINLENNFLAMAMSPDRKSLIVSSDHPASRGSIGWLSATGGKIKERLSWQYTPEVIRRNQLLLAEFVNNDDVVTADSNGVISLWSLHQRSLVWQIAGSKDCSPVLTHDRKHLIGCNGEFLFQIDLEQGQVSGCVPIELLNPYCFSISPDGAELICVGQNSVRRFELATGRHTESFSMLSPRDEHILGWIDDQQVLLGTNPNVGRGVSHVRLLDLGYRGEIWYYQVIGSGNASKVDGQGRLWSLLRGHNDEKKMVHEMTVLTLPHESVKDWKSNHPPDEFVLIKPGDSVKLEVVATLHDASQAHRQEMLEIFRKFGDRGSPRRSRPAPPAPSGGGRAIPQQNSPIDKLAEQMQHIKLKSFDAAEQGMQIAKNKLQRAGISIDHQARLTLHMEIGHPDNLRKLNQDEPAKVKLPYSIRVQAYVTDENDEVVWRSSTSGAAHLDDDADDDTTTPASISYLEELDIPQFIIGIKKRGLSTISVKGIEDSKYNEE